jgi:hypothetical protein
MMMIGSDIGDFSFLSVVGVLKSLPTFKLAGGLPGSARCDFLRD